MINVIQSPNETPTKGIKVFLAGGISNCPHWQNEIIEKLKNEQKIKSNVNIILFNPRCNEIPEEKFQTTWEYKNLKKSDIIIYWFSVGSINPITLFEYGSFLKTRTKKLIVGCHPDYIRKNAVIIQTGLAKPKLKVNESFNDFYNELVTALLEKITLM